MTIGIFKRVTILFAIPLLLASLLTPLLPAPTTYAAGNASDIDSDLQTTIRKYLNARWLVNCFTSNDLQKISSADVDSYNWFAGQDQDINRFESAAGSRPLVPQIIGAYYGAGKDATRGCSGENIKNAFTYLGFPDDGRSTYCSLGSQYEGSADNCIGGGDGEWDNLVSEHEVADIVLKKIREKNSSIFTDVESDPAGKYLTYYQSFINVCIDSVATTPYKTGDEEGRNDYYKIPVVTKADEKAKLEYYLGKGKDGKTPVALTALNSYDGHSESSYKSGEYGSFNASGAGTLIGLLKDGWRGIDIPDVEKDFDIQTKFKVPYGIRIQYFPKGTVVDCNEAVTKAREYAEGYKAYAQNKADFTVANPVGEDGPGSSETTCAVDGIGWIVCPVVTFLSKLNDAAFGFLNNFLNVPPDVFSDPATKQAWEAFRNIANIAFVIAFLIIIYSQITGAGVSNYGLKKLLPKLIIAAILVNVSYYVCAIAVDISNILGASLYDLIKGINIGDDVGAGGAGSNLWANAGAIILGGTAIIGLLALIIFAPTSLLAFALVIMILIARQAFVVLLIVISPLAFVAYLLPNTEQWFKKWWKSLVTILMVFPIIAVVFGASSLASDILIRVSEDGAGGGDDNQLMKIVGAAVLAVPLFAVPVLLKGALSAAGTIGAKVAGLQDKANGRMKRNVKEGRLGEAKQAFDSRRQRNKVERRLSGGYVGKGRLGKRIAAYGASDALKDTKRGKLLQTMGAPGKAIDSSKAAGFLGADRGAAAAVAARQKMEGEAVENAVALLQDTDVAKTVTNAQEMLKKAHARGDATAARAATRVLAKQTGSRGVEILHQTIRDLETESRSNGGSGELDSSVSDSVRYEVTAAGLKGTDRALDKWSRLEPGDTPGVSARSLTQHDQAGATPSGLNEGELAGQSLASIRHFAASGTLDTATAQRVLNAHAAGTIHLDGDKLDAFNQAVAGTATGQTGWVR